MAEVDDRTPLLAAPERVEEEEEEVKEGGEDEEEEVQAKIGRKGPAVRAPSGRKRLMGRELVVAVFVVAFDTKKGDGR